MSADWHHKELTLCLVVPQDLSWIEKTPQCPCTVVRGIPTYTVRPEGSDIGTGILDGVNWDTDLSCNEATPINFALCAYFHPGADVCIRGAGEDGTANQCCYDMGLISGDLLLHGNAGAGTPDRNEDGDHDASDVEPYKDCCKRCPSLCEKYIGSTDGTPGARSDLRSSQARCPNGIL